MNTRNSFEKKILEDFRNLPEEQRKKFLALIENLKAEVLQSNSNGKNPQKIAGPYATNSLRSQFPGPESTL